MPYHVGPTFGRMVGANTCLVGPFLIFFLPLRNRPNLNRTQYISEDCVDWRGDATGADPSCPSSPSTPSPTSP
jgi:hypothetical protein